MNYAAVIAPPPSRSRAKQLAAAKLKADTAAATTASAQLLATI